MEDSSHLVLLDPEEAKAEFDALWKEHERYLALRDGAWFRVARLKELVFLLDLEGYETKEDWEW